MENNQVILDLQLACQNLYGLPDRKLFEEWLSHVFSGYKRKVELTIRIVDIKEMLYLNWYYLGKNCPTNVLSFPFISPLRMKTLLLGDIVICRQIIEYESQQSNVFSTAHWAHMIIHGSLHLLGYDHHCDTEAALMERVEISMIQQCGYIKCCYPTHI